MDVITHKLIKVYGGPEVMFLLALLFVIVFIFTIFYLSGQIFIPIDSSGLSDKANSPSSELFILN